jgi:Zn-dependent protease with chaperone function
MNRLVLFATLTLGALFVAQLAGTAAVALVRSGLRRSPTPGARARRALALRLVPCAFALFAATLVGTAFLRHEPARTAERAGPLLVLAGAMGAWLLLVAAWRAVASLLLTRRLLVDWEGRALPLALRRAPAPARRLDHHFPVVAVVGVVRPRLFIAGSVLETLTAAELRAVLDHERAHVHGGDNMKRWLVRCCPDLPGLGGLGERLRSEWEEAAEEEADERAARRGRRAARHLASALVKVATLSPKGARLTAPVAALLSGTTLRGRVERLLAAERPLGSPFPGTGTFVPLLAAVLALPAVLAFPSLLLALHSMLEVVVRALA